MNLFDTILVINKILCSLVGSLTHMCDVDYFVHKCDMTIFNKIKRVTLKNFTKIYNE